MNNISITILCSAISGIIGVFISNRYYRKYEEKKIKFDILRSIMGYRYILTSRNPTTEDYQFFSALNEIFVVYNNCHEVIKSLKEYQNAPTENNLLDLIKRMCDELNIDYSSINDNFITRPFRAGTKA
ncbi:TPA: hypothetical protein PTW06_000955 [Clostridium botulinum]|nr:hypothetical protein [Clostridium botulinum]HDK7223564.1 hypothetical protein [Clostridium botulinum]HDK7271104.1 hypothetical protein [Clostridium botulinum]HDK7304460.1 hypothetical protein [Clostridium botulinum]